MEKAILTQDFPVLLPVAWVLELVLFSGQRCCYVPYSIWSFFLDTQGLKFKSGIQESLWGL